MTPARSGSRASDDPAEGLQVPTLTLVMPTIAWDDTFGCCAQAALACLAPGDQALIVFDGVLSDPPAWLLDSGAALLSTGRRQGPAAARNLAAAQATGELLVFVDADVQVHPDAIQRLRQRFAADTELAALFGSYDDQPAAGGLVSRFRNLLHHHTHSSHPGPASTFWAGLGAIRRDAFLAAGGFDARAYPLPSIEDIELGLRLHDRGARMELDPSIQGTHHKRWTLCSMLVTDIRQRAIPWSRLLLLRRELPATLNLDRGARFSAVASLVLFAIPLAAALLWPGLNIWVALAFLSSLALLLGLNRSLYRLLWRRMGWLQGWLGVGLHALYLASSSVTFVVVAVSSWLGQPLRKPAWLRRSPRLQRALVTIAFALLVLLAGAVMIYGLRRAWLPLPINDLGQRFAEWRLYQVGIYPSARLATSAQRAIPYFRTTVYLPWAFPLFSLLFAGGDFFRGKLITLGVSLLALVPISLIGWRSLRPWGRVAGWLGALAPVAIAGNSSCLGHPQFSMLCMGLLSLQWWLQKRGLPVPAGICWALAMLKPQIAAPFALTLLLPGQRRGLGCGLALLAALSAVALLYTHTSPVAFAASWLKVLPYFIGSGNQNALAWLLGLRSSLELSAWSWAMLGLFSMIVGAGAVWIFLSRRGSGELRSSNLLGRVKSPSWLHLGRGPFCSAGGVLGWSGWSWRKDPLSLVAVLSVVGQLAFYHNHYDNILLFPALLACWRRLLQRRKVSDGLLTALVAASLWTPQRLLELWPGHAVAQAGIWFVLGVTLAWDLLARFWQDNRLPKVAVSPA